MSLIEQQLDRLRVRFGTVNAQEVSGTGWVIRIPSVPLPSGWSKPETEVVFLLAQGYPFAKPDCFWADHDLRLAGGGMPQASNVTNPVPGLPGQFLWFSWHVDPWNPNQDDLSTWFAVIRARLGRPQ
jgi:hypothetical protein